MLSQEPSDENQIYTLDEIAKLRPSLSNVVLTGGVFDMIHSGHIKHLRAARKAGKTLIVHVTSDKRVREKKGSSRPINSQEDRAMIIAAIRYVDYVFIGDKPHYYQEILDAVKPTVLFFNQEAVSPTVQNYVDGLITDAKIIVSDLPHNQSTTKMIERIKSVF